MTPYEIETWRNACLGVLAYHFQGKHKSLRMSPMHVAMTLSDASDLLRPDWESEMMKRLAVYRMFG
jgi:hypothetical protein